MGQIPAMTEQLAVWHTRQDAPVAMVWRDKSMAKVCKGTGPGAPRWLAWWAPGRSLAATRPGARPPGDCDGRQ